MSANVSRNTLGNTATKVICPIITVTHRCASLCLVVFCLIVFCCVKFCFVVLCFFVVPCCVVLLCFAVFCSAVDISGYLDLWLFRSFHARAELFSLALLFHIHAQP